MSIKPAMTAEQWNAWRFFPDWEEGQPLSGLEPEASHSLAAAFLYNQPFGFTREEIPFLERANGLLESHLGESIAPTIEKILALLPPESS